MIPKRRSIQLATQFAALVFVGCGPLAFASESILFNGSPAYDCYKAAIDDPHPSDIDHCDLAINVQPLTRVELAATYSNRGVIHGRFGDVRQSMSDHNRAAELAPDLPNIYVNRANVFTRLKQYPQALDDLDRAIQLGGEVAHIAYYNRALLHQSLGNSEAARTDAETARKKMHKYRKTMQMEIKLTDTEINNVVDCCCSFLCFWGMREFIFGAFHIYMLCVILKLKCIQT